MAASTIRELLVSIGVVADDAALKAFDDSIEAVKTNLGDLVTAAAAAAAAIAAVAAAAIAAATATADYALDASRGAAALGMSTEAYQELLYAVERYGLGAEQAAQLVSKLVAKQADAVDGNEEAAAAFESLGISMDAVAAASPEELLALVADGMAGMTDESERLALATAIYGEDLAVKVLPLLLEGADGMAALGEEAQALGVVLSEDDLEAAAKFSEVTASLWAALEGMRNEIGLALIPALTEIAESIIEWVKANKEVIDQKIEEYAGAVADAFTAVADAVSAANDLVGGVEGWEALATTLGVLVGAGGALWVMVKVVLLLSSAWSALVAVWAVVWPVIQGFMVLVGLTGSVGGAFGALISAVNPLVWLFGILAGAIAFIGTLFAGTLLIVEDLWTYIQGGDSVFGRLIERWREADGALGALSRAMEAMGRVMVVSWQAALVLWDQFAAAMAPVVDLLYAVGAAIVDGIGAAFTAVEPMIVSFLDWITTALNAFAALGGALGVTGLVDAAALPGAAGAPGSAGASGLSATAAPAAAASLAGSAGAAAGGTNTVGGDTITISGVGMTEEQVTALIESKAEAKARLTASTFAAGEV